MSAIEQSGSPTHPHVFQHSLSSARLEALPEHCLSAALGHANLRTAALSTLAFEAVALFVVVLSVCEHYAVLVRHFD